LSSGNLLSKKNSPKFFFQENQSKKVFRSFKKYPKQKMFEQNSIYWGKIRRSNIISEEKKNSLFFIGLPKNSRIKKKIIEKNLQNLSVLIS